jgi:DNA-damage-inducible protein J
MPMTISIDDDLKRDFTDVCKEIGLPPSTAFGIFAKAVVRERAIPFALSAISSQERAASAYDRSIADDITRGVRQFDEGNYMTRGESRAARPTKAAVAQ